MRYAGDPHQRVEFKRATPREDVKAALMQVQALPLSSIRGRKWQNSK